MPKFIAKVACQIRNDLGKIITVKAGQVIELKSFPNDSNWEPVKGHAYNFDTVNAETLEATKETWNRGQLIAYAAKHYFRDLKGVQNKSDLIKAFIDARERAKDLPKPKPSTPVEDSK